MEHWYNETDAKTEVLREENHLVHHKANVDWPGIKPGPLQLVAATSHLSHGTLNI